MRYYIGDTHFGHENIIKYCKREFLTVKEMDDAMAAAIHRIDTPKDHLTHVGDFAFNIARWYRTFGQLQYPENNILIVGNHDRLDDPSDLRKVMTWFRQVVGTRKQWRENHLIVEDKTVKGPVRVLVSHLPQKDLRGCDFNVYGHFHNNLYTQPEREADWLWVLDSDKHLNAGVEVTDYTPMTLGQLIQANEEAKERVW